MSSDAKTSPRWRPRSLRVRVTAAFALGSLTIVGILGLGTYAFAEHYLVRQREGSLLRQAYVDARVLRDEVQRRRGITAALGALDLGPRSAVVVSTGGRWYGTTVSGGRESVPAEVRDAVGSGAAARQRVEVDGRPVFVVGLSLPSIDAEYYELFELTELERTLAILRTALIGSGVLAIVLGGLLGWWVSRRVLRPVADVAAAAERVAGGDFRTRIETIDDPDLDSLATSFNHMVDAVERRIERETRFVADVSHELRSPLTTLSTATELMSARRAELPPRAAQALDLLEGEVGRLCRLVDDLLELSRSDAGVADFRPQPVDVAELVRRCVPAAPTDPEGLGREAGPQVVVPEGPALATLDKRRLERVLANLVANAESHGAGLRRVTVAHVDGEVRIAVDDAGPGVDPTDRDAVFRRFYRGAASGRRASEGGSGLGLALVAEHVRLHGGRVWVEDAPDGGARFVVVLPGAGR